MWQIGLQGPLLQTQSDCKTKLNSFRKCKKNESPEKRCNSGTCGLKAKKGKQITDVPIALTRKLMLHLGRHKLSHLPFANDFDLCEVEPNIREVSPTASAITATELPIPIN